jgi:acetyl esterase
MPEIKNMTIPSDHRVFNEESIAQAVRELNDGIVSRLTGKPDMWDVTPERLRAGRARGEGSYPMSPPDPGAATIEIPGPDGSIRARVIRPKNRKERGTLLHIHGGGWIMGTPQENDTQLRRIAENTGLSTISVDYRLAPEHPYPAGPDDCEAAALWLLDKGSELFNTAFIAIGGESAGAHLAVVTLARLRNRHGTTPFHAANLVAGCYDLGGTPSVRNWGDLRLILRTMDVDFFFKEFLQNNEDLRDPDVSPLYAKLDGFPPALFTCGTKDLLIDDSLFMASRWASAAVPVESGIFPGGCHMFQAFESTQAEASLLQMDDFLNRRILEICN